MRLPRHPILRAFLCTFAALTFFTVKASAQDPTQVAAGMYKIISENARVRILDVKFAPGQKSALHSHPNLVAVILAPSTIRRTTPDGKSTEPPADLKRGSVSFNAASTHISENVGKAAFHGILIEFKQAAPAAGKGRNPSMPPPYRQVLDNAYVRVFDGTSAPGASLPEHTHGDHITISLTDGTAEVTDKEGKKETLTFKSDEVRFAGPATHSAVNTGKTRLHLIDVELK